MTKNPLPEQANSDPITTPPAQKSLLEVQHLKKYFKVSNGYLHAVDDLSFSIEEGKTLGVVGESGCGKSTLGRVLVHLLEATDGKILFQGEDITHPNEQRKRCLHAEMSMIFQDPFSSLNPRMTISETIKEPLMLSRKLFGDKLNEETLSLMETVGIAERLWNSYPHELDGGRRQRVGIARALALNPKFIVCDEPVSALDVSIQAQVLNLMQDLKKERNLTYVFITHDMSVVRYISDDICVMYLGQMVEKSPVRELFEHPAHPYTKALLSAIPTVDIVHPRKRIILQGELTSPINPAPGCRFASRCIYATEACKNPQKLREMSPGHFIACDRAEEINAQETKNS